jgi:hypothetical protein
VEAFKIRRRSRPGGEALWRIGEVNIGS